MPNINLRLTEEEHAALREWAHGSRRSIQREVVFRLFSMYAVPKQGGIGEPIPIVQADAQPRDISTRTVERQPRTAMFPGGKSVGGSDFVEKKRK